MAYERQWSVFLPNYEAMADKKPTVLKLVPTFSGEGDVSEWLEKVESVCLLNDVTSDSDMLYVITLRLAGEAYRVIQQMDPVRRQRKNEVVAALCTAYEVNVHDAYDMLRARKWKEGESVDGYMSALRKLAKLSGGTSDRMMMAAFVSGLPDGVKDVIRVGVGANQLQLADAVNQARQIISKKGIENAEKCLATTVARGQRMVKKDKKWIDRPRSSYGRVECYLCGGEGHIQRNCPNVVCYKCQKKGHVSPNCPENEASGQV